MKLTRRAVAAAVALSLSTLSAGSASAAPTEGAAVAAAGTCSSGRFCTWTQVDYYGTKYTIPDYGNNVCMTGGNYSARSYINNSGIQGYFYANSGCTGRARAITRGSSRDIGFTARSFFFACVTC